ncbi:hypothetical protein SCALM49S_05327 [Streptomyces californicus]
MSDKSFSCQIYVDGLTQLAFTEQFRATEVRRVGGRQERQARGLDGFRASDVSDNAVVSHTRSVVMAPCPKAGRGTILDLELPNAEGDHSDAIEPVRQVVPADRARRHGLLSGRGRKAKPRPLPLPPVRAAPRQQLRQVPVRRRGRRDPFGRDLAVRSVVIGGGTGGPPGRRWPSGPGSSGTSRRHIRPGHTGRWSPPSTCRPGQISRTEREHLRRTLRAELHPTRLDVGDVRMEQEPRHRGDGPVVDPGLPSGPGGRCRPG